MRISDWSSDVCSSDLPHRLDPATLETGECYGDSTARRPKRGAVGEIAETVQIHGTEKRHSLPLAQAGRFASGDRQRRDVGQRGLYRKKVLAIGRNMPECLEGRQRDRAGLRISEE